MLISLLKELNKKNITLSVENDNLKVKAPENCLTDELKNKLKEQKNEIINFINSSINEDLISRLDERSIFELSFSQERLWFLSVYEGGDSKTYHMPSLVKLSGSLDIKTLEHSISCILQRHDVLRTNFVKEEEKIIQYVNDNHAFVLNYSEISNADLFPLVDNELLRNFDLEKSLLFRASLFKTDECEYYLFVNMHHIISDGWSINIFLKELSILYKSSSSQRPKSLNPLRIQYGDYAAWQKKNMLKILKNGVDYWKQELKDIPMLLLPTSYARPAIQKYNGKRVKFQIGKNIFNEIDSICKTHKVTLFMFLLSVFSILLHKYTSQKKFVIGCPIANRKTFDVEQLIGFFVNTLPIKVSVNKELSFLELLSDLKKKTKKAYDFQDIPFEKIVEALKTPRDTSRSPIFQVMLILQNTPQDLFELPNLKIENIELQHKTSKFDLTLDVNQINEQLYCSVEYSTSLFSDHYINNFIEGFKTVLNHVLDDDTKKLKNINIVSEKEKHWLLDECNNTKKDYPREKTIHRVFEEKVKNTPNAIAVVYKDKEIAYKELNEEANKLANYLIQQGVEVEDLIGICVDRSIEMVVGLLAVLKAGAAYVPIDPTYPKDRINYMIKDSKASFILTQMHLKEFLVNVKSAIIFLDRINLKDFSIKNPKVNMSSRNLAYVIFTSGSTGKPKGVMVEHRSVLNLIHHITKELNVNHSLHLLSVTPVSFDIHVLEIFTPIVLGGKLSVASNEDRKSPQALDAIISNNDINCIQATPATFNMLMKNDWKPKKELIILCGGEEIQFNLKSYLLKSKNIFLWNMYGPTETTVWSTTSRLSLSRKVNIGKPINNTQIYLLDDNLNLVPRSVVGELCISGDGLARGYLNNSKLTSQKFVDNPYLEGERLYKTGDLAKYLEDGNIEYVGRVDEQVKIRGFRIELGEIENVVSKIDGIKSSICVVDDLLNIRLFCQLDEAYQEKFFVTDKIVNVWGNVWDNTYSDNSDNFKKDSKFHGWVSSYTEKNIPEKEMLEWVENTTNSVLDLNPKEVLEVGCGTGLLLYRLYKKVKNYIGIDISEVVISNLRAEISKKNQSNVKVYCDKADDFKVPSNKVDTIIINSVIQYFPNILYLESVIGRVISSIGVKEGRIFIGDVINFGLQEEFYHSIYLFKNDALRNNLKEINFIKERKEREEELFIHPAYFLSLMQKFNKIVDVKISLKEGLFFNEINNFRYDVTLYISNNGVKTIGCKDFSEYTWLETNSFDNLIELINTLDKTLIVKKIQNRCLSGFKSISEIKSKKKSNEFGLYIFEIACYLKEKGYKYEISPTYDQKYFDLIVTTENDIAFSAYKKLDKIPNIFFNNPASSSSYFLQNINNVLEGKLPEYMLPKFVKVIHSFPLTPNGKIDKKSLLSIGAEKNNLKKYVEPKTNVQKRLANIFKEVLAINEVSIKDSFFDLGGHSLLAVTLINRINKNFDASIPLSALFRSPSIIELENILNNQNLLTSDVVIPINNSKKTSMFAIPGLGADAISFQKLGDCLKGKYKLYAIQHTELKKNVLPSVQNIAKYNIIEMKKVQSRGPYTLLGYSFGATIAYEMVHQLLKNGDKVDKFIILDAFHPLPIDLGNKDNAINVLIYNFITSRGMDIQKKRIKSLKNLDEILSFLQRNNIEIEESMLKSFLSISLQHIECSKIYIPKPLPFSCYSCLLRVKDDMLDGIYRNKNIPEDYGWGNLLELDIYEIPGNHMSVLQENYVSNICNFLEK